MPLISDAIITLGVFRGLALRLAAASSGWREVGVLGLVEGDRALVGGWEAAPRGEGVVGGRRLAEAAWVKGGTSTR